jgi:hypothetical protein
VSAVGKHTAAGGASDPIVAAALASRPAHDSGAHAADGARAEEHPVGWPAPPAPGGGGLGWPADADAEGVAQAVADEPDLRRGWRRFFGPRRAAA